MTVELDDGGGADLRILVDASVVEVFAGDGHALTARVYPDSQASTDLVAGANSGEATPPCVGGSSCHTAPTP